MILADNEEIAIQSSKKFETSGFKIAASAKAFKILSDSLYTNKIRAIIRELSCNALDSHIAAGNPAPFDVSLPSKLLPEFSVRDYGTGMTNEIVMDLYTTYFSSTKTDSNDYVGALGLGSKTPFSYTDSFTVVSWVPNPNDPTGTIKTVFAAYLDGYGAPAISILSSKESTDPVGVMIQVQVDPNDINKWESEASYVLSTFERTPNIVNTSLNLHTGTKIENTDVYDLYQYDNSPYQSGLYFLMGNIPYPIPDTFVGNGEADNITKFCRRNRTIMIRVPIGTLDIAPSREALSITPQSSKLIKETIDAVNKSIYRSIIDTLKAKNLTPRQMYSELKTYRIDCTESIWNDLGCDGFLRMLEKYGSKDENIKYDRISYRSISKENTYCSYSSALFDIRRSTVSVVHFDVPMKYRDSVLKKIGHADVIIYNHAEGEKLWRRIQKSYGKKEITETKLSDIIDAIVVERKVAAAGRPPRTPSARKPYEIITSTGVTEVAYKGSDISKYSGVYFCRSVGVSTNDVRKVIDFVLETEPQTEILVITKCMEKYINKTACIELHTKYDSIRSVFERDVAFKAFHCESYINYVISGTDQYMFKVLADNGIDIFSKIGHDTSVILSSFERNFISNGTYRYRNNISIDISNYVVDKIKKMYPLLYLVADNMKNSNKEELMGMFLPELISHINRIYDAEHTPKPIASHYQHVKYKCPVMASHYQPVIKIKTKRNK